MRASRASICALLLFGCDPVGRAAESITMGEAAPDETAVVALLSADGHASCSGVVIAPRAILTASHCATGRPIVALGVDPSEPDALIDVVATALHPEAGLRPGHDLAVLELAADAPAALAIARASPPIGARVRTIGFGHTAAGGAGAHLRRAGSSLVERVDPSTLTLRPDPSLPCEGDSGGAILNDGELVAIVASGDPGCSSYAIAARVDVEAEPVWLAAWADAPDAGTSPARTARCDACPQARPRRPSVFLFALLTAWITRRATRAGA